MFQKRRAYSKILEHYHISLQGRLGQYFRPIYTAKNSPNPINILDKNIVNRPKDIGPLATNIYYFQTYKI